MRLPGFKSITALIVLGTAGAVWQAHERNIDRKNAAESLALVQQRHNEWNKSQAKDNISLGQEKSAL
jgi:hypothetical protein